MTGLLFDRTVILSQKLFLRVDKQHEIEIPNAKMVWVHIGLVWASRWVLLELASVMRPMRGPKANGLALVSCGI